MQHTDEIKYKFSKQAGENKINVMGSISDLKNSFKKCSYINILSDIRLR